ncbi:MAG: SAM-dependent methyltransferase, partial [Cyanobacteria bacterium P01_H01_bin.121]
APFLIYLYYAFDHRPWWFKAIWHLSNLARNIISRLPHSLRYWLSVIIAILIYWPLARLSLLLEKAGLNAEALPLSFYRAKSFYCMRTDALDRFGTRLEKRFSQAQIRTMLEQAGLEKITFSDQPPYWCALGYKV